MTIEYIEGFNSINTDSWPLHRGYSTWNEYYDDGVTDTNPTPRKTGDRYLQTPNFYYRFRDFIHWGEEFIIGCAIKGIVSVPFSSRLLEAGMFASSWPYFSLGLTYAGRLNMRFGSWYSGPGEVPTYTAVTPPNTVPLGQWFYFEFHMKLSSSPSTYDGFVKVYINEEKVMDVQNIVNVWTWGLGGFKSEPHTVGFTQGIEGVDDVYIKRGTNLTPLGDCRCDSLRPSADHAVQFTREDGASNAENVNHAAYYYKTPTGYVESDTFNQSDLYEMGDLPIVPDNIYAVAPVAYAMSAEGSVAHMKYQFKGANTGDPTGVVEGNRLTVPISLQQVMEVHELNPATGAPWDPSEVNAMRPGFKFVASDA